VTRPDPFSALGELPRRVNTAGFLYQSARAWPEREAVIEARTDRRITFAQLEARASHMAAGLRNLGVEFGDRVSLFVPASIEFVALTFALFKLGAVPVLADPGMGRKRLLASVARIRPRVMIGVAKAHAAQHLFPAAFESVQISVTVGRRLLWSGVSLAAIESDGARAGEDELDLLADTGAQDEAAILFTSGSTGPPKGVLYTHGTFHAQVLALKALYGFEAGEVDLACFPLFALFDVAFGSTSVFPDMDVSRPATCDPAKIVSAAQTYQTTGAFGSPAIWKRVAPWCLEKGERLGPLTRLLVAGAPVGPDLIRALHAILPLEGDVYTPYGATECLPVTSIPGRTVVPYLEERIRSGRGTCVGRVAPGIDLRLIVIRDEPIERWSDDLQVAPGELGEVVVRGPVVTAHYVAEPEHDALAKIQDEGGGHWHRMGDLGYMDDDSRLWFCGRKSHRLRTSQGTRATVPVENIYNTHPRVVRTALVGVGPEGEQLSVLCVQPTAGSMPKGKAMTLGCRDQLKAIGRKHRGTAEVETFLFHPEFPVDPRHNAKIEREQLQAWASEQLH